MFVASLNLDVFFKKVFSNKKIAKNFLQDFFGVKITEIKRLATDYKVTDDAVIVKFDYRCKINGKYVVIEMQQKYKTDVNKRFYLYHCLGTALQLEILESKVITKHNGETYSEKNYSGLEPIITLIWMVDDSLNFIEDFIAFTTLPEAARDFIVDEDLWKKPYQAVLAEREKTLTILNNTTKNLDFFSENRLIYAFQGNVVRNKKITTYFKWFDFAQLSRNLNNVEEDFSQFNNDEIMAEVIKRLRKDRLAPREYKFVSDLPLYEAYYLFQQHELEEKAEKAEKAEREAEKKIARLEKRTEKLIKKTEQTELLLEQTEVLLEQKRQEVEQTRQEAEQTRQEAEQTRQEAEQTRQEEHQKLLKGIENLLRRGDTIESIADLLVRSVEEITAFVAQIETKKY
jgi:predicted  nucleic acid-binding Zn-ribbon protein